MGRSLRVGELVSYADDTGEDVGALVVEIRRSDCRVLELDTERSFWLPQTHLRRGAPSIRKGSATSLLSSLVLHLDGIELEVERIARGAFRAQIGCRSLEADDVDRIRRYFGPSLRSLRILPGGLGKVLLTVEFAPTPENHSPPGGTPTPSQDLPPAR